MQVGVHQGSLLSLLLFAMIVNVMNEFAKEDLMNNILFTNH